MSIKSFMSWIVGVLFVVSDRKNEACGVSFRRGGEGEVYRGGVAGG